MANQPQIKKEGMVEEGKKQKKKKKKRSKKNEEPGNSNEQRDTGWIYVICVHDTTHLAITTIAGRAADRSRTTPHKEKLSGLVKPRDYAHY